MPFTTGFLSGFTLTSTLVYFALLHHQRSRADQAAMLRGSSFQINALMHPKLASDLATIQDQNYSGGMREGMQDYRLVRRSRLEQFKDGWNKELENAVKWVHEVDIGRIRESLEDRVSAWRGGQRRV